jgi:pimeloyl-ACP methyl ester carboxylesterase
MILLTWHTPSSIVFVHGEFGSSSSTWTKDTVFWPRDLLPTIPPYQDASIFSFEYDTTDFLSCEDPHAFTKRFLESLESERLESSGRPIILVGSSLGGQSLRPRFLLQNPRAY